MSEWGFGFSFDMELEKPLDFFCVNYKNGDKVRYDKRPHGKWIYHKEWECDGECAFECSKCGMGTDVDYNFCPNCGSDNRPKEGEKE